MIKLRLPLLALCLTAFAALRAQVVVTEPSPLQEDSPNVAVIFNAAEGNGGLAGFDGPVYAHTGAQVVGADGTATDWKYAPQWLDNDPKFMLESLGGDKFKLVIGDIRQYYGIADNETVAKLCFVFRNANGSLKGVEADGSDIYVDVLDSGFQLSFRQNRASYIVGPDTPAIKFTATATEPADLQIFVGSELIASDSGVKELVATYKFQSVGNYDVKAVGKAGGAERERHLTMVYARDSQPSADTSVPPMGMTQNPDGSRTFCFAAPGKEKMMLMGSWNGYMPDNAQVMDYVDVSEQGAVFRYFKTTLPASVTGDTFGYFYYADYTRAVGDPYARLVLDPANDKYIKPDVYPGLPEYPEGLVPANTVVAWTQPGMLDYDWTVTGFKGAAPDNLVIYELLFRDFTGTEGKAMGNGTVRKAIDKIDYLKSLNINAVELLPINEFNGNNSWGYNPNFYFAVDKAYGTPQDYKEFIDKCHQAGIAVILDVVFNQADWLHPWYMMYPAGESPFFNAQAPHAYSVLNDWNQGHPLVAKQWADMLQFWLGEYKVDGFRFDLVKGLGDNDSYANSGDSGTNAYNASRVARMKTLHDAMRQVNPDAYFINENLAGAKEENEMAADGELNWANVNNAGCQFAMGYQSDASLNRMWAKNDQRTPGSTVAYLESHDEQRLGYKQVKWGVSVVKNNHDVAMRRLGSAAAQMILAPGSHMIWMFSEMGNAQNTKDNNGGNNTSPKTVDWALLDDPDNAMLMESYAALIALRLENNDLFAPDAQVTMDYNGWAKGRKLKAVAGSKELYLAVNPNTTGVLDVAADFNSDSNSDYEVRLANVWSPDVKFDAAAKTISVPANSFVVVTTASVAGIDAPEAELLSGPSVRAVTGGIRISGTQAPAEIYTAGGVKAASAPAGADAEIALPAGIYVVRVGSDTWKVRI